MNNQEKEIDRAIEVGWACVIMRERVRSGKFSNLEDYYNEVNNEYTAFKGNNLTETEKHVIEEEYLDCQLPQEKESK